MANKRRPRMPRMRIRGDAWGLPLFDLRDDYDGHTERVHDFAAGWRQYRAQRARGIRRGSDFDLPLVPFAPPRSDDEVPA